MTLLKWMTPFMALLLFGGCITLGAAEDKNTKLSAFLDAFDEEARKCAPRELAEARANLAFGVYEAEAGRSSRAVHHLDLADVRAQAAWKKSQDPRCERDTDQDGIPDSIDNCPTEPEDFDGDRDEDGCPEFDRDGDGLDDPVDQCPDDPEDLDGFEDTDGCPDPDNDQDRILDADDQCPNEAEDPDGFEDIDGCPDPDNDQDGFLDPLDMCPMEPEDFDGVEDDDGCPDLVVYKAIVVTAERIELKQTVYFATGKARILPRSYDMMNEIVDALSRRTKIRVRIEGHTDSRGSERSNRKLSQARADSVRQFLIDAGISADRLIGIGYGENRPVANNKTKKGRAKNRRVEFYILQQGTDSGATPDAAPRSP